MKRPSTLRALERAAMAWARSEAAAFYEWSGTLEQRMRRAATFFSGHRRKMMLACARHAAKVRKPRKEAK